MSAWEDFKEEFVEPTSWAAAAVLATISRFVYSPTSPCALALTAACFALIAAQWLDSRNELRLEVEKLGREAIRSGEATWAVSAELMDKFRAEKTAEIDALRAELREAQEKVDTLVATRALER